MIKKNKWQLTLIIAVACLTLYNILPTIFFYINPLKQPINDKRSEKIIVSIMERVNRLELDAHEWVESFNKLIGVKAKKIKVLGKTPQIISVAFSSQGDADRFKMLLPRAGSLIPFYPSQLSLQDNFSIASDTQTDQEENTVYLQRKLPIKFNINEPSKYFTYSKMYRSDKQITQNYENLIKDRILQLAMNIGGPTENASLVNLIIKQDNDARVQDFIYIIAQNIINIDKIFSKNNQIANNFYQTFTQGVFDNKENAIEKLLEAMTKYKDQIQMQKLSLKEKNQPTSADESLILSEVNSFVQKEDNLLKAISIIKRNSKAFASTISRFSTDDVYDALDKMEMKTGDDNYIFEINNRNPIIESIIFDLNEETLSLQLKKEITDLKEQFENNDKQQSDNLNQLIFNEIAKISRESSEQFAPSGNNYITSVKSLPNSKSFLTINLSYAAKGIFDFTKTTLQNQWNPVSKDLQKESYPIIGWAEYNKLPLSKKNLSLVLYSPIMTQNMPISGFKMNSIYVIAKDLTRIAKKYGDDFKSEESIIFQKDFQNLSKILKSHGFFAYPGSTYPLPAEFANDYIFEISDFYLPLLQATRENFTVHGTKKIGVLEFSDVQERIITLNKIETQIHEDLLKWQDEYNAAQVDRSSQASLDVPKPTKNVLLSNLLLSCKKYFRGDEKKTLSWGLDLSGGKNVQIVLKDNNNKVVSDETNIRQGINELFNRVNKMGVSDVSIRQEGTNITLDFPGSQSLSAADLIKSSSMTFNIINEKFDTQNSIISKEANQFLQDVWNEAVVTNKKDLENINLIAWSHLYGEGGNEEKALPRSDSARILYENELRFANPNNMEISNSIDTKTSRIAIYSGDNFADWHGQTHPLLFVFKNHALEGSNLENVHGGYDTSKGNYLSFEVKKSQNTSFGQTISPRKDLHAWTSIFSKDNIIGTPYELHMRGHGWRMAVILNGYVVSAPQLESPLKDSGMITGHFTQREINKLVADLKAGSLSFTPQILSERSVSPELGLKERAQGITAAVVAILAVVLLMVSYYRFAGVVASLAVIFNIFIIWATLQNIGASITLAGIAGIILTIGMAVDANVLVFERIREELEKGQKLSSAISSGYRKAFSAIVDSNLTTIIAAVILLNFDSGPIKGFAITLIIGVVSSMFTALFITRYFFSRWILNPKHKRLTMSNLIKAKNFNFIKYGKSAIFISAILIFCGVYGIIKNKDTIFGMDFTGGYAVIVELQKNENENYKLQVISALKNNRVSEQDVQVKEMFPTNIVKIFFGKSMDKINKPFYTMPFAIQTDDPTYKFETNPRLVWLVKTLEKSNINLTQKSLQQLDQNWKSISGQMSETMREQACIGLVLALICILIYITFRFEFKFAISATLGLAFDILITISMLSLLHLIGVPLQIDLNIIAALMTIIGYSLNDTIIVFDRVRDDIKSMRHNTFKEIVNHALNITLSRTLLTSFTTLLVLISLVILGGKAIFGFSLIMAIGIVIGTLSTFFISSTLLIFFQKNEEFKKGKNLALNGA